MVAKRSAAQRLGRVLEQVTRQSGRLPETPDFGSWLLGRAEESQTRRRVRIQIILTVFVLTANLLGIGVSLLLVAIVIPVPSIFTDAPWWLTWVVSPAYTLAALLVGT
jgi:adenylate cyclase